ncbi:MAG: hypothetical protein ACI39U_03070 [Candidatus Cryptobacteroides sp.]
MPERIDVYGAGRYPLPAGIMQLMKEKEYIAPLISDCLVRVEAGSGNSGDAPADNEYGAGAGKLEYDVW